MRPLSAPEMSGGPVPYRGPTLSLFNSKLFSMKFAPAVTPPSADLFGLVSHRYVRLSKNNIRTLLELCKDAGMNVDIHTHVVEEERDAEKVFNQNISVAL